MPKLAGSVFIVEPYALTPTFEQK